MLTYSYAKIKLVCEGIRKQEKTIAFTNGCFDLFHYGHLDALANASQCADNLIVGVNSDKSVKMFKNETRPIISEYHRAMIVYSLKFVKHVVIFEEEDPIELLGVIQPDIYVKGEEYSIEEIENTTCKITKPVTIKTFKKVPMVSTTEIIRRIMD